MNKPIKTAWNHIRRSPYQALAAILIMMLTFLAISVFSFLIMGSTVVISYFESQPQINAFFKDEAQQPDIDALEKQLQATGRVKSIKFISKQEALEIYKQQNKSDPLLMDLVTADILPASLQISGNSIEDLPFLYDQVKKSPLVDKIVYQQDIIDQLKAWTSAIRKIGVAVIIILTFVSIFIMATIIGFKISAKKEEIEIMRLLSATKWYVRWPFIFEGMFYGVVGATLGWLIATVGLINQTPFLESFLKHIPVLPASYQVLFGLLGVEMVIAIILGCIASFLAVLRYLK